MGTGSAELADELGAPLWLWILNEYIGSEGDGTPFDKREGDHPVLVEPLRHPGRPRIHPRTSKDDQPVGETLHHLAHTDGCRLDRDGEVHLGRFRPLSKKAQEEARAFCTEWDLDWVARLEEAWLQARQEEADAELARMLRQSGIGGSGNRRRKPRGKR